MSSRAWDLIRADFRTLLDDLSLSVSPKALGPEEDGRATFGADAWLVPGRAVDTEPHGAGFEYIRREMTIRRGLNVTADMDSDDAYDAYVAAQDQIISTFLNEENQPSEVFDIRFEEAPDPIQQSATYWIIEVTFTVVYSVDVA
jgi:hypothetical protein